MTRKQIKKKLSIYLDKHDFDIPSLGDMVDFAQEIVTEATKELEKENAELKLQNTNANLKGLEMQVAKDSHRDRANKTHEQLIKAKEHIENLLYYVKQCSCERSNYAELEHDIAEAEQFLKEVKE